jgi:hypothetical protein
MSTKETSLRHNTAAINKSVNSNAALCNTVQESKRFGLDAIKYKSW